MRITTVRRISQVFFFTLFIWLCAVSTFGDKWWRLRGWPVNFFLHLDPLPALSTLLSTHTLYRGLAWSLAALVLALMFGRVFCGWICPFGALHQLIGWLGFRNRKIREKISANQYRKAAGLKYLLLIAFASGAALPLNQKTINLTGLLDPIPLFHRFVHLVLLPLADRPFNVLSVSPPVYDGAWGIGLMAILLILLNLVIPRFFCRFICPTGAFFALVARFSLFRIGRKALSCSDCMLCESACEGACNPAGKIRIMECLSCFNCYNACKDNVIGFRINESESGEINRPDFTRRGLILSSVSGILAVQMFPLGMAAVSARTRPLLRPPGSLPETDFLQRCIRCGQCMRICPANIVMPSGLGFGMEQLWTPVLNFSEGGGGCLPTCTACGHVCPTAAIRRLTPEEKTGVDAFKTTGPVLIGHAVVDRSRCLPWAFSTPCIVCQEVCPVTPKAIWVRTEMETVRFGERTIVSVEFGELAVSGPAMEPERYGKGDGYLFRENTGGQVLCRISGNTQNTIILSHGDSKQFGKGDRVQIQILLLQPVVDLNQCIGCGICEHECPVHHPRAIRVYPGPEAG